MPLQFVPILSIPQSNDIEEVSIGFNDRYAYIAARNVLWRTDLALTGYSQFESIPLAGKGNVHALYVDRDEIYVLKEPGGDGGHAFLRSRDGAKTFESLDDGLEINRAGERKVLVSTRMAKAANTLFVNAGGGINIFASVDDGKSWSAIRGSFIPQMCYPGKFLICGNIIVAGGECPLDSAYLLKGTLDAVSQ